MIPRQTVAAVLSVIVQDTGGGSGELFPTLMQKGGNAGGTMAPSGLTPKEVANALPQGRQPVKGVFMAFRSIAQAWPVDFDHRKDGDRPTIDVAIGPNDSDTTALLRAGAENFQFCPKDAKTKWSAAAGGPGLLRPIFQILVYLPDFDDVIVVQAPPLLESWVKMGQQVAQFQDKDGGLAPFPVVCEPTTEPWYEDNNYHFVKLSLDAATGATAMAKYDAFVATVQSARPDLAESVMDWFNGADKPLNDAALAKLKQAANMTNPRKRRS